MIFFKHQNNNKQARQHDSCFCVNRMDQTDELIFVTGRSEAECGTGCKAPSVCLSVCPPVSIFQSVCLSVCLSLFVILQLKAGLWLGKPH